MGTSACSSESDEVGSAAVHAPLNPAGFGCRRRSADKIDAPSHPLVICLSLLSGAVSRCSNADRAAADSCLTLPVCFPLHPARPLHPQVLYPAVPIPTEQQLADSESSWRSELHPAALLAFVKGAEGGPLFLSINRFERKKGIGLALHALAKMQQQQGGECGAGAVATRRKSQQQLQQQAPLPRLVIAGGYDVRLAENRCDAVLWLEPALLAENNAGCCRAMSLLAENRCDAVLWLDPALPQRCVLSRCPSLNYHIAACFLYCHAPWSTRSPLYHPLLPSSPPPPPCPRLREHLEELKALVVELGLQDRVAFLPSFTDR